MIPPNKVEYFPNLSVNLPPVFKPTNVNIKLTNEKMLTANILLLDMVDNPIPTLKLSMLTLNANKIIAKIPFKSTTSSFLNSDVIISIEIIKKMIPTTVFGLTGNTLSTTMPIKLPNNGIKK